MQFHASLRSLLFFAAFVFSACNVSDEGGGITPDCTENQDCLTGVCVDGECQGVAMDAGNNGMDASNHGMDARIEVDSGTDMSVETDMGDPGEDMGPTCPEGRVDRNGAPNDGCELPAHPAANDPTCEPCWNLDDAIAGCNEGSCQIVACLNGKTDRDGLPMNGCEEDCGPGECWTPVAARQDGLTRVDDDWFIGSGPGVAVVEREQGLSLRWVHANNPRDFVTPTASRPVVLDDNMLAGIKDDTIVLSDDLGLTWREANLPTAFGATAITRSESGRGVAAGFSGTCEVRQCPAESCDADETCNSGVCEGNDCTFDSDCLGSSICGMNSKCIDPGNVVCRSSGTCGGAQCNFVGNRLLVSDDFETWTTSGVQTTSGFDGIYTNSDGSIIIGTSGASYHRTTDDGASWQDQSIALCPSIHSIEWNSSDRVVLGGSGCLMVSQDDGATFNEASVPGGVGVINDFVWLDDSTVIAGGNDILLRSSDAGLNWVRSDVEGAIVSVERLSDASLLAFSAYQGVWSSTDEGANWTNVREARSPLPSEVSAGDSGILGTDGFRTMLPPSSTSIAGPWQDEMVTGVKEIQQFGTRGFVATADALWWGTDLTNVAPQPIDPGRVNLRSLQVDVMGNRVSCGTSGTIDVDCQIINIPIPILEASYNDSVTYVATSIRVRFRISILTSTQTVTSTYSVLLGSGNQSNWEIVDEFTPRGEFVPTVEGMITEGFYSPSPAVLRTIGDTRCDGGPFLVRTDGSIVSFERPELCLSSDGGGSWSILATAGDFAKRLGAPTSPVVLSGTNLGVLLDQGRSRYLVVSDDGGQNWRDLEVVMPSNMLLSSDGVRELGTSRAMLLRGK